MSYETLLLDRRDRVATITVNRPDALNALNATVLTELAEVAELLAADDDLDAVILTGAGRAFVAGADIKAMVEYTSEQALAFSALGHRAFNGIAALPVPVIGAINGFALGGGLELALSCDMLYGSTKARLGLPEVTLSVIPGWGGTQRLGRFVGWHRARELVLTARQLRAEEAQAYGLLLDVVEPDELLPLVNNVADTISKNGPLAVRAAKRAVAHGAQFGLPDGLNAESAAFSGLFGTDDQREGMKAFIERRPANFTRK